MKRYYVLLIAGLIALSVIFLSKNLQLYELNDFMRGFLTGIALVFFGSGIVDVSRLLFCKKK